MNQASTARAFLRRLHPWLGKAVHTRWSVHRSRYREELDALLIALQRTSGRIPPELQLRLEGFLGRLWREWFPADWRPQPTYAEVLRDFRWWLGVAERWGEAKPRPARAARKRAVPPSGQPEALLKRLGLPPDVTEARFMTAWRRYVKTHHPDLNPDQTPEERRRFAEAMALKRR